MTIGDFTARLSGVRHAGSGFQARCPSHEDERNSLSVAEGQDGRILIKCFSGCSPESIVQKLGLTIRDLFAESANFSAPQSGSRPAEASEAVYGYRDVSGRLLAEKVRYAGKRMIWRRPDGKGGHVWNRNGVEVSLYRLDEIAKRRPKTVYVCEGEKDADRLWSLGWPATTAPNGADSWRDEYAHLPKDAGVERIVILPDNDDPGRRYAHDVARSCDAIGLKVKVVPLPGLSEHGDVSDFLSLHAKDELAALVKAAPAWEPPSQEPAASNALRLVPLGELLARPEVEVNWLWQDRLPLGGLSDLVGKPKAGKSTVLRCFALAVSRGEPFLGCDTAQGQVWYIALEEREQDVRAHFRMLGATGDEPIKVFVGQAPADIVRRLHDQATRDRPSLVIIDPMQRFLRVKDLSDYAEVSNKFDPVLAAARDSGAAIQFSHHSPKSPREDVDAGLGSIGIVGSVHAHFVLRRDGKGRTLSSLQRTGPDLEPTTLEMDPRTGWITAGLTRTQVDEADAEAEVLRFLKAAAGPLLEDDIRKRAEARTGMQARALRVLRERGHVTRTGDGKRGAPFLYTLSEDARLLVPTMERERENEHLRPPISPDEMGSDSRSRCFAVVEGREQASEGRGNDDPAADAEVFGL